MSMLVDKRSHKGFTIEVHYDECPSSPREMDNLSEMAFSHKRYDFPNDGEVDFDEHGSWTHVAQWLRHEREAMHIMPVYMMDHSGLSFRVAKDFGDPWDSGQIGLVYTTPERIKVCGTPEEHIDEVLIAEVEEYGKYVSGEMYGFIVRDEKGKKVDDGDCWGYYEVDDAFSEAEATVDAEIRWRDEQANDIAADAMQELLAHG